MDLTTILGANLGQTFKDVVGAFKLDPEKKAEFQAAIDANAALLQQKQLDLQGKLADAQTAEIATASANIRAEAQTGDKYTSRARPSFIYLMLGIMAANYVAFPLLHMAPIQFPDALFWLFGSCMLGYTGARTWEKIQSPAAGKVG